MSDDCFNLYKIFKDEAKVTMTEKEIARLYGVTLKEVQKYIQEDLKAKLVEWEWAASTFYLTTRGFEFLFCIRREM